MFSINVLKTKKIKEKKCQTLFIGDETDYRKVDKKEIEDLSMKSLENSLLEKPGKQFHTVSLV